ncbi:MarR family transcriptional regulator [Kitasatospora cineracea]|uniref:MarR family transcriptional regulator n=1 Tax=Kitasatospora cineracea TaxID=88074 RepID=UPI0036DC617B
MSTMTTASGPTPLVAFWFNSLLFEYLPNAGLTPTERDVLDILFARQEPGGVVFITQAVLSERLGVRQPNISKAPGRLSDLGIIDPPHLRRRGRIRPHKLLAAQDGPRQAIAAVHDESLDDWPLNIPTTRTRPARIASPSSPKADSERTGRRGGASPATVGTSEPGSGRKRTGRPGLRVV